MPPAPALAPEKKEPLPQSETVATALAKQLGCGGHIQEDAEIIQLLKGLPGRLGSEWPLFQADCDGYAAAPEGEEKDRLAYVINARLQVTVAERPKYPQLRALFEASHRNWDRLERERQRAEVRSRQGG